MPPHDVPGGVRALGWDVRSRYSANRGDSFSRRAVATDFEDPVHSLDRHRLLDE
jgi:hypothetical protein